MKENNPEAHEVYVKWQDFKKVWERCVLDEANNGYPRYTLHKMPVGLLIAWAKDICQKFNLNLWQVLLHAPCLLLVMSIVHSVMSIVHSVMYIVHSVMYIVHSVMYSEEFSHYFRPPCFLLTK